MFTFISSTYKSKVFKQLYNNCTEITESTRRSFRNILDESIQNLKGSVFFFFFFFFFLALENMDDLRKSVSCDNALHSNSKNTRKELNQNFNWLYFK